MKIYACHLLNDYSGSPKVLMQLIKGWIGHKVDVTIVTAKNRNGFLSNIKGADYLFFPYAFTTNFATRLLRLIWSQVVLFFKLFGVVKKEDIIYVNTVLPFGAALLGKLKGCRVIYHIHETSVKPAIFKRFLFGMIKLTASEVICVSKFLNQTEIIKNKKTHVLYNAIDDDFFRTAKNFTLKKKADKNILMICSLKAYKGVNEFIEIAKRKPNYKFKLVVNAAESDISHYFANSALPKNLSIFPAQSNTHPFYQWADVVLNLSRPAEWVETFGLTIVEAMSYGLPVIVPPVGGITELVDEGFNGYRINSNDPAHIAFKLSELLEDEIRYKSMRKAALYKIGYFKEEVFINKNLAILRNPDISPCLN
ncbi:MAG: glycosyltransferase family 4 protein [Bacteroidia bacterium]|nr:glycosyltransferase family 4 protein [Bacteroidia bacterium]